MTYDKVLVCVLRRTQFLLSELADDVSVNQYGQQRLDDTAAALDEVARLLRGETADQPTTVEAES